jgi:hypothetical protein
MDILEKKLLQKYGTKVIPKEDIPGIVKDALDMRVIQEFELNGEIPSMTASQMMEHFAELRRNFFLDDSWKEDEDNYHRYDDMAHNYDNFNYKHPHHSNIESPIMDNVMKAYKEYISVVNEKEPRSLVWIVPLFIVIIAFLYISYTPAPY